MSFKKTMSSIFFTRSDCLFLLLEIYQLYFRKSIFLVALFWMQKEKHNEFSAREMKKTKKKKPHDHWMRPYSHLSAPFSPSHSDVSLKIPRGNDRRKNSTWKIKVSWNIFFSLYWENSTRQSRPITVMVTMVLPPTCIYNKLLHNATFLNFLI